jgi:hypothetical protein
MPDAGPDMAVEMDIVRRMLDERDRRIAQLVTDTTTLRQLENEVVSLREVNAEMLARLKDCEEALSFFVKKNNPAWTGDALPTSVLGQTRAVIAAVEDKP